MKLPLLPAFALLLGFVSIRAAEVPAGQAAMNDRQIAAVTAADAERMAATIAGDSERLDAILSDELRYAHSSGKVDNKASLIASLTNHSLTYESFDYQERNFLPAGPGAVLMTGRVIIHASTPDRKITVDLNFVSVWRKENGKWRFLAWQSCTNPPASAAAK